MRLPKAQKLKEELEVSHWTEITSGGLELSTSFPFWLSLSSSTLPFLAPLPVERMNWILSLDFSSMHEMDFIWSGTRNEDNIRIFTTTTDTKGLVDMSKKNVEKPLAFEWLWYTYAAFCFFLHVFTLPKNHQARFLHIFYDFFAFFFARLVVQSRILRHLCNTEISQVFITLEFPCKMLYQRSKALKCSSSVLQVSRSFRTRARCPKRCTEQIRRIDTIILKVFLMAS